MARHVVWDDGGNLVSTIVLPLTLSGGASSFCLIPTVEWTSCPFPGWVLREFCMEA